MVLLSSNYDYDIIIVGGGISGLFLAYKLLDTGLNILVLESSNRLGGRIQTFKQDSIQFECGAARFHKSHAKLLSLIHELNLEEEIIELPKDIKYILRNKLEKYDYNTKNELNIHELFKKVFQSKNNLSKNILIKLSFFQYLILLFDQETALFIKDAFGYDAEFIHLNAYVALNIFGDDLFKDNDYFVLKNGLSQIIERLEELLGKATNVIIKTNCSLKDVFDNHILTTNEEKFNFNHLIMTIPQMNLLSIPYFKDNLLLRSVKPVKLLRIYAKYPKDNLWFQNIERTTTDNYIRHIIPIDKENGLIMISYTDDKCAKMWNDNYSISEKFLIKTLHKEINSIYKISPPDPEFISVHYWENGIHMWKTGQDIDELYPSILKLNHEKEVYIAGESFSKRQGWIEGSLETCYDIIKILPLNGFDVISDDSQSKDISKIMDQMKYYSIDEVLQEKNWIILDHNGRKPIYDIKKWIPNHPGGNIILEGIKKNMYYKDKNNHPQSPIQLFREKHANVNADKIIMNNLINKNPQIKLIGYLK